MPYMMRERKDNEVYVGNTDGKIWPIPELQVLKTVRLGEIALDADGYALPRELMRPVFVHLDEIDQYNEIKQVYMQRIQSNEQLQPSNN